MVFFLTKQNLLAIAAGIGLFGSVACGDKPSDDGTASESTSAADSSSGSGTDAPTTSGGAPSTATGDDASSSSSSGETGETSGTTSAPTSTTSGETSDDSTTGGELCEIQPAACGFAAQLGNDVEDCGVVNPRDDAAAWQGAHDCAVAAAAEQRSFCLVTVLQGIDSDVAQAYAAQEARSYALTRFFFDSDPCGGGGCGPKLTQSGCETLTAIDDCVIEPGNACLSCDGQGQSSQLCGP